jgi:hypothetical protein
MSIASDLLAELRAAGFELSVRGGKLHVEHSGGAKLTEDQRDRIKHSRDELLQILSAEAARAAPPPGWVVVPLAALVDEASIVIVGDEEQLDAARAAHPDLVVYVWSEIEELLVRPATAEALAKVHAVKKRFLGRLLRSGDTKPAEPLEPGGDWDRGRDGRV